MFSHFIQTLSISSIETHFKWEKGIKLNAVIKGAKLWNSEDSVRDSIAWFQRLKLGILMMHCIIDPSTTNNSAAILHLNQTIYILRLPQYMVSDSTRTSPSSVWATTEILDTGSGNYAIRCLALSLDLKCHMCPDCNILPDKNASWSLSQISSAFILLIRVGNAVYKATVLVANNVSVKEIICTGFMNCCVNSNRDIGGKEDFSKGKVPLLGNTSNKLPDRELKSMEDHYSGLTTNTQTKKIDD